jgi:hypothetical protein
MMCGLDELIQRAARDRLSNKRSRRNWRHCCRLARCSVARCSSLAVPALSCMYSAATSLPGAIMEVLQHLGPFVEALGALPRIGAKHFSTTPPRSSTRPPGASTRVAARRSLPRIAAHDSTCAARRAMWRLVLRNKRGCRRATPARGCAAPLRGVCRARAGEVVFEADKYALAAR